MKELKEGKITYKELAEWFGISYNTFKNNGREKRLEILKAFAEYHFDGKSLIIDKVLIPEYQGKAYAYIGNNFSKYWHKSGIDSCTRVGKAMYNDNLPIQKQIKEKTAIAYTNKVKVERYGKNTGGQGTKGVSYYCWCKPTQDGEDFEIISSQEKEIMDSISKKVYWDEARAEKAAILAHAYSKGEITIEEYNDEMKRTDEELAMCNQLFEDSVIKALGYMPLLRTKLEDCAFDLVEEGNFDF